MEAIAIKALVVAGEAISKVDGITHCSIDNDNKSSELIFTTKEGRGYVLSLKEIPD